MENLRNKFASIYPSLDLHGERPELIYKIIDDYINDNIKLDHNIIVIVHGKGTGVIKEETHYILKNHPKVLQYILDPENIGQTIVEISK